MGELGSLPVCFAFLSVPPPGSLGVHPGLPSGAVWSTGLPSLLRTHQAQPPTPDPAGPEPRCLFRPFPVASVEVYLVSTSLTHVHLGSWVTAQGFPRVTSTTENASRCPRKISPAADPWGEGKPPGGAGGQVGHQQSPLEEQEASSASSSSCIGLALSFTPFGTRSPGPGSRLDANIS